MIKSIADDGDIEYNYLSSSDGAASVPHDSIGDPAMSARDCLADNSMAPVS